MRNIVFNPLREFEGLIAEMERLQKNLTPPPFRSVDDTGEFVPGVDIIEDEHYVYLEVELPGVKKEDVKLTISDNNILNIRGEKIAPRMSDDLVCIRQEADYGRFMRSFQMPENVDTGKIKAHYDNGMLYLTLPKMEPVKPKEIPVRIG